MNFEGLDASRKRQGGAAVWFARPCLSSAQEETRWMAAGPRQRLLVEDVYSSFASAKTEGHEVSCELSVDQSTLFRCAKWQLRI